MCLESAACYNLINSELIKKKKICRRDSQEGELSIFCWFSGNGEEFKSCMLELIHNCLYNIDVGDVFILMCLLLSIGFEDRKSITTTLLRT